MRLTCPNCGARYEVDDAMIPPEGRDVQCSDCSTTWFQPGRPVTAASVAPAQAEAPAPQGIQEEPEFEPEPEPEFEPEPEIQPARVSSTASPGPVPDEMATRVVPPNEADEEVLAESIPEAPPEDTGRRQIDPAIRNILREEAEREKRLREAEAVPVETQAEMPLEEESQDARRARRRAELEEAEDAFTVGAANAAHAVGPRRDLLPDIEEINSTLRASEDRAAAAADVDQAEAAGAMSVPRRRRGMRIGFVVTLAVAAGLFWAYVNAGLIAERAPGVAPAVESFAAQVDAARFWLDDLARGLVEREGSSLQ
jgi:predicted Zn finger-like uncharacterized protein